jgi:hypothetical protein
MQPRGVRLGLRRFPLVHAADRRLNLPWLLLALSSKNGKNNDNDNDNDKNNPTDSQGLTGSFHIRSE